MPRFYRGMFLFKCNVRFCSWLVINNACLKQFRQALFITSLISKSADFSVSYFCPWRQSFFQASEMSGEMKSTICCRPICK